MKQCLLCLHYEVKETVIGEAERATEFQCFYTIHDTCMSNRLDIHSLYMYLKFVIVEYTLESRCFHREM